MKHIPAKRVTLAQPLTPHARVTLDGKPVRSIVALQTADVVAVLEEWFVTNPRVTDQRYVFEAEPFVHDDWAVIPQVYAKKAAHVCSGPF